MQQPTEKPLKELLVETLECGLPWPIGCTMISFVVTPQFLAADMDAARVEYVCLRIWIHSILQHISDSSWDFSQLHRLVRLTIWNKQRVCHTSSRAVDDCSTLIVSQSFNRAHALFRKWWVKDLLWRSRINIFIISAHLSHSRKTDVENEDRPLT